MKIAAFRRILLPMALLAGAALTHAESYSLRLRGQKSGDIRGSVTQKGREGTLPVVNVSHSIVSPRDPVSGLPTGQRMHKPFVVKLALDKASPLLFQILCTNENVTEVELKTWAPLTRLAATVSPEVNIYTVKLTNANISSIDESTEKDAAGVYHTFLTVSFTYQKIEWTWTDGGITAEDDWEARV